MEEKEINFTESAQQMDINADSDIPGHTHLSNSDDTEDEESTQVKLEAELQEQNDKYLRLFAEFDNYDASSFIEKDIFKLKNIKEMHIIDFQNALNLLMKNSGK